MTQKKSKEHQNLVQNYENLSKFTILLRKTRFYG
jgi:hypothetical protein